jgi:hypothetical protein
MQLLHNKYKEQNFNFEGKAMGTRLQVLIPVYWSLLLWHYQILHHDLNDHSISSSEVFKSQAVAININITFYGFLWHYMPEKHFSHNNTF